MKKLFKILYYIFLSAILVIAVLLIVSIFPITGNFKFLTVLSGSMEPAIKTGSVVLVKPTAEYQIGDVITFGPNTKTKPPTTHRIVEIKNENGRISYTTKGDANNAPDQSTVSQSQVIGKVIANVPYVGYAIAAARKPYGFIVIVVIPAALVILDEMQKIWVEIKRVRAKKREDVKEVK